MSSWRDTILGNFAPKASKLTLTADPDNLLTEEKLAFGTARARVRIERLGLPEVRQHRHGLCDSEEAEWRHELQSTRQFVPEIRPLLMLNIINEDAQ